MSFGFENLLVYRKAIEFASEIYRETKSFPKEEMFGLSGQLRRAAVSISANIAEGSGRYNKKDFGQYLKIARGSASECVPLLEIAKHENYIPQKSFEDLISRCNELGKMINGLMKSISIRD